jgi:hypothetical protein
MAKKWWEPRTCVSCGQRKKLCCPSGYCKACHEPQPGAAKVVGKDYCNDKSHIGAPNGAMS